MNIEEISVYVLELKQPYENWGGLLKDYDFINNYCTIENNKGVDVKVNMNQVLESDSDKPIKKYLSEIVLKKGILEFLHKSGLSTEEADTFYNLSKKICPPQNEIDSFYKNMSGEEWVPFEGGMGSTEAIVGLVESFK